MNATEAARETLKLLAALKALGGPTPSDDLQVYLNKALGKSSQRTRTSTGGTAKQPAVRKRGTAEMLETIQQLAARLQRSFDSDAGFEAAIIQAETAGLTKDNVVDLYNRVFGTTRNFPKSLTKPALFKTIRQDRLKRVRDRH